MSDYHCSFVRTAGIWGDGYVDGFVGWIRGREEEKEKKGKEKGREGYGFNIDVDIDVDV